MSPETIQMLTGFGAGGAVLISVWMFTTKVSRQLARIHDRIDAQNNKLLELMRELVMAVKRGNGHGHI